MLVAAADQRDRAIVAGDARDDLRQHGGELGACRDDTLGVGLGRRDLQQRHDGAVGLTVGLDRVVGQLEQLLDADAGVAQHLDRRPGPERVVLSRFRVDGRAVVGLQPRATAGAVSGRWPRVGAHPWTSNCSPGALARARRSNSVAAS